MDKELLKKYHFWILLIPFMLFAAIAWIIVLFGVSDATAERITAIETHAKTIKSEEKKAKAKILQEKLDAQKQKLIERRTTMWSIAWNAQKQIFNWPKNLDEKKRIEHEALPFGTTITNPDVLEQFRLDKNYLQEYLDVVDSVLPMKFNGGWGSVMTYVPDWGSKPVARSEDIWLALEDFWVQRELVYIAQEVNQKMAAFQIMDDKEKKSPLKRTFRSRLWELELEVTTNKNNEKFLKGTLKNITNRLQILGIGNELVLKVSLDEKDEFPFEFIIEGEYLKAGEKMEIKTTRKHLLTRPVTELAKVEQRFDERTIPIKQIDKIAMGYPSSRGTNYTLKMAPFSQKAADEEAGTDAPAKPSTTPAPKSPGIGSPPKDAPAASAGTSSETSFAGLVRNRYIDITAQVRRMPVAMALIADVAYIPDILEAVANSKLRIQLTQYHWSRYHEAMTYTRSTLNTPRGKGPAGGGKGLFGPPGTMPPGSFPPGGGIPGGGIPGGGADPSATKVTESISDSLVEISLYGIATIYQQYVDANKKN